LLRDIAHQQGWWLVSVVVCISSSPISLPQIVNRQGEVRWPRFSWSANEKNHSNPNEVKGLNDKFELN